MTLIVVVGLRREASIVGERAVVGLAGLTRAMDGKPAALASFGLCGALDPGLGVGALIIADGVSDSGRRRPTDMAWSRSLRLALHGARGGDMAGSDDIAAGPAEKSALRRASEAVAVDMESHHVARAAEAAGIPFVVVRAVSDTATRALSRAALAGFTADGEPDVGAVVRSLVGRPWELPALIRTALDAEKAYKSLEIAATALTPPPG